MCGCVSVCVCVCVCCSMCKTYMCAQNGKGQCLGRVGAYDLKMRVGRVARDKERVRDQSMEGLVYSDYNLDVIR